VATYASEHRLEVPIGSWLLSTKCHRACCPVYASGKAKLHLRAWT